MAARASGTSRMRRASRSPLVQLMERVQASSDEVARVMADGLRLQAELLEQQVGYIEHWLGREPEGRDG